MLQKHLKNPLVKILLIVLAIPLFLVISFVLLVLAQSFNNTAVSKAYDVNCFAGCRGEGSGKCPNVEAYTYYAPERVQEIRKDLNISEKKFETMVAECKIKREAAIDALF